MTDLSDADNQSPLEHDLAHDDETLCASHYQAGRNQIIYKSYVADTETAVGAMMKLSRDMPYACLLESVEGGEVRGRYSIIAIAPDVIWRSKGNKVEINRNASNDLTSFEEVDDAPLPSLRALIAEGAMPDTAPLPSMSAGLFGYFGYDMIRHSEAIPDANPVALDNYDSVWMRPTIVAIFDRLKDTVTLATQIRPQADISAEQAYQRAHQRLAFAKTKLSEALPSTPDGMTDHTETEPRRNITPDGYKAMVAKAKDYIAKGDIFQVVLSQRFSIDFALPPMSLYRSLRRLNPSPFLFYFAMDHVSVVGSSPEILVRLRDGELTIRPIAGTRKRGATAEEDAANAADLLADTKERAEHLMLLDLGRNDVGRVAQPGSVRVVSDYVVEYYSHVMHIASEVRGQIREGFDGIDAMLAGFPAGTVSGSPKIRAMEIIDELEPDKRGIYAGAIGYIGANGDIDTCIALRTAVIQDGQMHIQAGAGIVYDSIDQNEQEECENKARALIRAAHDALRFGH
ncbi:MAG: anthranilate synthase component I [Candidatus Puniceispirillaceae bacterium]